MEEKKGIAGAVKEQLMTRFSDAVAGISESQNYKLLMKKISEYGWKMAEKEKKFRYYEGGFRMELVNIREIFHNTKQYENQEITIGGWVRSNRNSKNFGFIVVNDGTFLSRFRLCTPTVWTIMMRSERSMSVRP